METNELGRFKPGKKSPEFEVKRLEALRKKGPWNKGQKGLRSCERESPRL